MAVFNSLGFVHHRMAHHISLAAGWFQQTGEHRNCRGFSCTIGAQQTEDLPLVDIEIDLFYCHELAKTFLQFLDMNGWLTHFILLT